MKVYTVQINYKSGISVVCDFVKFDFDGRAIQWEVSGGSKYPIMLGAHEIESAWILATCEVGDAE